MLFFLQLDSCPDYTFKVNTRWIFSNYWNDREFCHCGDGICTTNITKTTIKRSSYMTFDLNEIVLIRLSSLLCQWLYNWTVYKKYVTLIDLSLQTTEQTIANQNLFYMIISWKYHYVLCTHLVSAGNTESGIYRKSGCGFIRLWNW